MQSSVQQLMFGASAEQHVAISGQNHSSDGEMDGVRDEASTIWTINVSECRGEIKAWREKACLWMMFHSQNVTGTKIWILFSPLFAGFWLLNRKERQNGSMKQKHTVLTHTEIKCLACLFGSEE